MARAWAWLRVVFGRHELRPIERIPMATVLVDQPSARPTRKWTAAAVTEVLVGIASIATVLGFDLASEAEAEAVAGGVVAVVVIAGRVAAYFTRNRAR